jgi:flagellar biosynthesis GTPase FlhF
MPKDQILASIEATNRWGIGFCIAAAIGAIGLAVVAFVSWRLGNSLQIAEAGEQRDHENRLQAARNEAADASARAEGARAEAESARENAAKAEERAAKAESHLEEAHIESAQANERAAVAEKAAADAQLRLEQFKAPRRLTNEQRSSLFEAMRKHVAIKFDMGIQGSDPEAGTFAGTLESVLIEAGWAEVGYAGPGDVAFTRPGKPVIGMINMDGVWIQTHQRTGDAANAAARLSELLNKFGIKTKLADGSSTNLDGVHVYVGKKAD